MEYSLTCISPLDGRYKENIHELSTFFSEGALIHYRIRVEAEWFIFLCNSLKLKNTRELTKNEVNFLRKLYLLFSLKDATRIKKIEKTTNHDVKAVEYFIKAEISKTSLNNLQEFIHFACTSEDINNISYALMLKEGIAEIILPHLLKIRDKLAELADEYKNTPMLARTHGQAAIPTTVGKEFVNFLARLDRQINNPSGLDFLGKINGAVGNFNAHHLAYPTIDWITASCEFVSSFGLTPSIITTQIEPHDFLSEIFATFQRINTILIDMCRDMWSYISFDYFVQKSGKNEVGSSTMPHKINPIDFENAEGNLGLANALFIHFLEKLPLSRLQRDLTDSTVMRNIGVAFGYCTVAYKSIVKGFNKLKVNEARIKEDLESHPEILTEAIQTVLRKYKKTHAYEKLKDYSCGKKITLESLHSFINTLNIGTEEKLKLKKLRPSSYTGLAAKLVKIYLKNR